MSPQSAIAYLSNTGWPAGLLHKTFRQGIFTGLFTCIPSFHLAFSSRLAPLRSFGLGAFIRLAPQLVLQCRQGAKLPASEDAELGGDELQVRGGEGEEAGRRRGEGAEESDGAGRCQVGGRRQEGRRQIKSTSKLPATANPSNENAFRCNALIPPKTYPTELIVLSKRYSLVYTNLHLIFRVLGFCPA
eukprot:GHVT01031719.1.p1 GENE.GHVT01031719.1~~GHVT01031719.1.p1  ORF type:complete len:188 (+),score=27.04 GHVT01031719.1:176-739(+)